MCDLFSLFLSHPIHKGDCSKYCGYWFANSKGYSVCFFAIRQPCSCIGQLMIDQPRGKIVFCTYPYTIAFRANTKNYPVHDEHLSDMSLSTLVIFGFEIIPLWKREGEESRNVFRNSICDYSAGHALVSYPCALFTHSSFIPYLYYPNIWSLWVKGHNNVRDLPSLLKVIFPRVIQEYFPGDALHATYYDPNIGVTVSSNNIWSTGFNIVL